MTVFVFAGPSLDATEGRQVMDAVFLPPVALGDVYRMARQNPDAIGIVDGYFERRPAVWHKEILWALQQGVPVYGSGSMGALRAAELSVFGMRGVGQVYRGFASGRLEDDDEVAVSHGLAEVGYRAQSEAMVNIRATLAAAELEGVINGRTRSQLEKEAKSLFYPLRTYSRLLRAGAALGVSELELTELRSWLPAGRRDVKHEDALMMLELIQADIDSGELVRPASFHLEHTKFWEAARRETGELTTAPDRASGSAVYEQVLDELRIDGCLAPVLDAAFTRWLALNHAIHSGYEPGRDAVQRRADDFRRANSLLKTTDVDDWMAHHDMDGAGFARLMHDEARIGAVRRMAEQEAGPLVLDQLRLSGDYERLLGRARDKQERITALGMDGIAVADTGLTEEQLVAWYFRDVVRSEPPSDLDRYAAQLGFSPGSGLRHLVLREWAYRQSLGDGG